LPSRNGVKPLSKNTMLVDGDVIEKADGVEGNNGEGFG
jgi:hypothetical protein